jgi:hypothetical protein
MPYFVYRITEQPGRTKQLEHVATFDKFQEAKQLVRSERPKADVAAGQDVRMIFAKNEVEAQALLQRPREERVIGED